DGDVVNSLPHSLEQLKLFKPRQQAKRTDYLQWDEYFMSLAFLSAMRSKDPSTQVGACIVSQDNKIVSMGYNGMPVGLSDDDIPWTKNQEDVLQNKSFYVCHAELNAVINKNVLSLQDCRMYTTLFPCHECAKVIIQSGIKEIVYFDDKKASTPSNNASKIMFMKTKIKLTPFVKTGRKINISLN
ncbi:unnamed protein product, partial [Hymenolepis diminuta]